MSGPEQMPSPRERIVVFDLPQGEEQKFIHDQGIVLKNKDIGTAKLHQMIRVKGHEGTYEAEVVAIQEASSGEEAEINIVLSFVRKIEQ